MRANLILETLSKLIDDKSLNLYNKLDNNNLFSNILDDILKKLSLFNKNELYHTSKLLIILKEIFLENNNINGLKKYDLFFEKLLININFLNKNMKKIRNDMFKKIPHYFVRFNYKYNEYDIIPHCFIENSVTKNNPRLYEEKKIIILNNLFFEFKNILRKSYYYYVLYLNDLILQNQYLKIQIIKMELARYGKISGTAIDCIIHFYMDCYIINQKEINNYLKIMNELNLDQISIKLMQISYLEKYHNYYNNISKYHQIY